MAATQEAIRSEIIPVSEIPWENMEAGVRMKKLWRHEASNRQALMVQIDPGSQLPMHRHLGNELVYVVKGAIQDEFGTLTTGNVGYRPDGCVHTVSSPNGAGDDRDHHRLHGTGNRAGRCTRLTDLFDQ